MNRTIYVSEYDGELGSAVLKSPEAASRYSIDGKKPSRVVCFIESPQDHSEWKNKNILFLNGVIESLTVERDLYRQALEKIADLNGLEVRSEKQPRSIARQALKL